jgi:anti-sigma B factor antagonist
MSAATPPAHGAQGDPRPAPLRIEAAAADGHTALTLVGDLTYGTASGLEERVRAAAGDPDLVVDVTRVRFCDSAGLAALIGLQRRSARRGGTVTLAGAPEGLRRVLHLTGVEILFTLCPARAEDLGTAARAGGETA